MLDFAIAQVGRVQALYMHPVSFIEYLANIDAMATQIIFNYAIAQVISDCSIDMKQAIKFLA